MNWRKVMGTFLASIVTVSLLAGCVATTTTPSATPAPTTPAVEQKVTIEFWGWWSSATRMPTIDKIVNGWNANNPNIQVKYTAIPFDQILTKYLASVAAGNPPDVVATPDIFTTPTRGAKKQAMDLSSLGADAIKDDFYAPFWNAVLNQGKVYGLPWVGETKYMYYNKDIFAEVGLDPEKGPVTWDDLVKFSDKIDKKDGAKIVRAGFHPMFGNFGYRGWVWNAKSNFFDDRNWPTVNTAKNIEVMNWMKTWTDRYGFEGYSSFKGSFGGGPNHPFITGKVGMIIETATWEGELKKNGPTIKYGIVPVPTEDGKQHQNANYTGGFAVEVPVGSKHPAQAFKFATHWATDAAAIWAKEQNDFPAWKKAPALINTPEFTRMSNNMVNTGLIPLPLFAPSYNDALNVAIDDVLGGKKDAAKALGDAQGAIQKMVQENTNK